MGWIRDIGALAVAALLVVGALINIYEIGKPQKPTDHTTAILVVIGNMAVALLLISYAIPSLSS